MRSIVDAHQPDFIAFQEVSQDAFQELQEIFRGYRIWPPFPTPAGTAILTNHDWVERGELKLSGNLARRLTWLRTTECTVATVHLESVSCNTPTRLQQLDQIFAFLAPYKPVVLLGDFNFAPDWEENRALPADYVDAWSQLRGAEPGYTEDTTVNLMRLQMKGKEKQVRFDRVLCGTGVHPRSIEMVGTEPIEALDGVWPSDHFGLICEVDFRDTGRSHSDTLLMLGQSCRNYGAILQERLKEAHACLSVGSDPESPSLSFKASKLFTNEDALLVRNKEERYLMAVADGHFGLDTSHALINRLAGADFPESLEELMQTVHNLQLPSLQSGAGSSLTVAHLDLRNGLVWGVYTGDSTACLLTGSEYQPLTESNTRFVYFNRPLEGDEWQTFQAAVPPGTLLLLFTDGINECHYRSPDTSIQPGHITVLWKHVQHDPKRFSELLMELALGGVGGKPGGQDNIALVGLKRPG